VKLRIGLVGLGSMGMNHYRIARNHPDIAVAALCDTAGGEGRPEPLFRDLDLMLSSAGLDAAILCVPTHLHHSMALKCIDRGLPVLIEKPLASTAAQGRELLGRVETAGARIAVGHVERFNPVVNALIRELEGKDLFSIQITRVGPFPPRISDVGVLTDLSVHDIDLIRYISKREILASRIFKSRKVADHHEDNAILSFFLEREVVAGITTNWLTPFKKRSIEVATAEAYYEANLMTQQLIAYSAFQIDNSFIQRDCHVQKVEPLAREIDAFVHFVRTGEHGELATAADGLRPLELIESNAKDP
jgi:UDP-N-acetylglucosamine 3-dehydrogenase